eukprot:GFYU01006329.1.p1 GENE.GFYU01006329.1~~GFYU01006329.1.p1  ORF type:complete len:528 (+),score=120.31 GFYU01006329.1:230-1813(+)
MALTLESLTMTSRAPKVSNSGIGMSFGKQKAGIGGGHRPDVRTLDNTLRVNGRTRTNGPAKRAQGGARPAGSAGNINRQRPSTTRKSGVPHSRQNFTSPHRRGPVVPPSTGADGDLGHHVARSSVGSRNGSISGGGRLTSNTQLPASQSLAAARGLWGYSGGRGLGHRQSSPTRRPHTTQSTSRKHSQGQGHVPQNRQVVAQHQGVMGAQITTQQQQPQQQQGGQIYSPFNMTAMQQLLPAPPRKQVGLVPAGDVTGKSPKNYCFKSQSCSIPHPAKINAGGGEDAHFVETDAIGVADGVGGWVSVGVDAGIFARTLMKSAGLSIGKAGQRHPVAALTTAYRTVKDVKGSCTACIMILNDEDGTLILDAANLGDSGFLVIRGGTVVFYTEEQVHFFNCPFQLGEGSAGPEDAERIKFPVQAGDVIVAGSDGLFDNMSYKDILHHVLVARAKGLDAAQVLGHVAFKLSADRHTKSPFQQRANEHGMAYQGGKMDDITVLVSEVVRTEVGSTSEENGDSDKMSSASSNE